MPAQEPLPKTLTVQRKDGRVYSPLRAKWLVETPEERVRQEYLTTLVEEYGYALEQMQEEVEVTGRGSASARADFVVWRTPADKADHKAPLIVIECKSDNVTIRDADYAQGENYARHVDAPFFVTHNNRETRYWRVLKDRMPGYVEEITDIPHANDSDKAIKELIERLKTFREDEFADLLHKCHNIIRNREHKDPAAAFDEIAKILFVKVFVERELKRKRIRENRFTVAVLDQQFSDDPVNVLFTQTRDYYRDDRLFVDEASRKINLKPGTSREIVRELERYNLSDTSEDIKGIAFERFLGRTFRGEIGQFFTPRPIVEFMVRMVDLQEDDVVCDPASGSGGFLIRAFEIMRETITAAVDAAYRETASAIEAREDLDAAAKAARLREADAERGRALDQRERGSRLWTLANRRLYGTDANDRMARTSKMNMIMHGDGHGGVHHHNGFLNVNGIFEGRFDVILTNPPFGSSVEKSDEVRPVDRETDPDTRRRYEEAYPGLYAEAQQRLVGAVGKPIASLFDLGGDGKGKVKTEILFLERCLSLLAPGGRLAIVLPEGILNNPSLAYVREYAEDRAFVRAVVSLPQEAFASSGASVKASLLFMQRFTADEKAAYDDAAEEARVEAALRHAPARAAETERLNALYDAAKRAKDKDAMKALVAELRKAEKAFDAREKADARAGLKARWRYPVFLYEAERVGITATGEADLNELLPSTSIPPPPYSDGLSALELYQAFRKDPHPFPAPVPPA